MTIISIPTTIGSAGRQLAGIDKLLTASQWERAAIVWAFTEPSVGGRPSKTGGNHTRFSFTEFAAKRIRGLTDKHAVAEYHRIWQEAIDNGDAPEIEPGDRVELPTIDWPGRQDTAGQRRYADIESPAALAKAVNQLPTQQRGTFTQDLTNRAVNDIVERTAQNRPGIIVDHETTAQRKLRDQPTPVEVHHPPNRRKVARDEAYMYLGRMLTEARRIRNLRELIDESDWPEVVKTIETVIDVYQMLGDYYRGVDDKALAAFIEKGET